MTDNPEALSSLLEGNGRKGGQALCSGKISTALRIIPQIFQVLKQNGEREREKEKQLS